MATSLLHGLRQATGQSESCFQHLGNGLYLLKLPWGCNIWRGPFCEPLMAAAVILCGAGSLLSSR